MPSKKSDNGFALVYILVSTVFMLAILAPIMWLSVVTVFVWIGVAFSPITFWFLVMAGVLLEAFLMSKTKEKRFSLTKRILRVR